MENGNNNNNNSVELSGKSPTKKLNSNQSTANNLRLRITPSSTSSISYTFNVHENHHTREKISTGNTSEIIDESDQVERIEAVRNNQDEISFRIKLINETEAQWISSKIANRKYSQAVIAFWENHVEFT
jgi:Fe-S cluster assembly iron-binding protein IscA